MILSNSIDLDQRKSERLVFMFTIGHFSDRFKTLKEMRAMKEYVARFVFYGGTVRAVYPVNKWRINQWNGQYEAAL